MNARTRRERLRRCATTRAARRQNICWRKAGRGLFFALEFLEDRADKRPFDPELRLHEKIKTHALQLGLGIYPSGGTIDGRRGDHVLIAPPYNSQTRDIEMIVDRLEEVVTATFGQVR